MGDKDHGGIKALLNVLQLLFHDLAHADIKCTDRLIQQNDFRIQRQCSGDCHTLLLSAG